jgi:Mg/Co/Ni transporter MgtE
MSKVTIVTDIHGNLVGAVHGHSLSKKHGDLEATVSFHPSHKLHKVEVDVDIEKIKDLVEYRNILIKHIPKH